MEAPDVKVNHSTPPRAPFQYSLRTLLIIMTVLAVVLSGVFAGPEWISVLTAILLGVMAPMALTIGLIYGRGYTRTFCIGGMFPAGLVLLAVSSSLGYPFFRGPMFDSPSDPDTRVYVGVFLLATAVVIIVMGLVAMGVRWMVEAPQLGRQREASARGQPPQPSDAPRST